MALKGDAADLVYGLPECRRLSFDQLGVILGSRFGAGVNMAADKKKLKNRRKLKDESWNQMGQDIAKLARRIYITAPDVAESEAKDAFIQALPEDLKLVVAAGNPPTLRDCIENVTQLCSVMNRDEKQLRVRFAESVSSDVLYNSTDPIYQKSIDDESDRYFEEKARTNEDYAEAYRNKQPIYGPKRSNSPSPRRGGYSKDLRDLKCYFCHEPGHILKYCPKLVGQPRCARCIGFGHTTEQCVSFSLPTKTAATPKSTQSTGNGRQQ